MNTTTDELYEDLREALQAVATDAQHLIQEMGDEGASRYGAAVRRIERSLDRAREDLSHFQTSVLERARRAARAANHAAHDHPWEVAGASVLLGAALGGAVAIMILRR